MPTHTKSSYVKQLEAKIAQIESRMAREWRFYAQYSTALVRAKLLLQIQINNHVALAAKKAKERSRQALSYISDRAKALRETNIFAYFRLYAPRAYDWGITENLNVIE